MVLNPWKRPAIRPDPALLTQMRPRGSASSVLSILRVCALRLCLKQDRNGISAPGEQTRCSLQPRMRCSKVTFASDQKLLTPMAMVSNKITPVSTFRSERAMSARVRMLSS